MKRIFVFSALMSVATVLSLMGCGVDPMKNISERRSGYFTASDGSAAVTAVSGVRETPYALDGVANTLKPYTLITLVPATFDVDAVYTYIARVGENRYGGTLTVHPFAASFSAEFDFETATDFIVTVTCGGVSTDYRLVSSVTPEMIDYSRAVEVAQETLGEIAYAHEIRARIIKNPLGGDGICWHIEFIGANDRCGVLLDPVTAKTLAVKT